MSESQTIFRIHREERDRWTQVFTDTVRDSRLSFKATGLLVFLLSCKDDWVIRQNHLSKIKTDGRDSVVSAMDELQECGYLEKRITREKGVITGVIWNVFEKPKEPITDSPESGKPETVKPIAENPQLSRNKEKEVTIEVNPPKPPKASASPSLFPDETSSSILSKIEKTSKVPTHWLSIAIANLYSRRLTTEWSEKELKAYKKLKSFTPEDMETIKGYYEAERAKKKHYLRKDLLTFLNNFPGELDRANEWKTKFRVEPPKDDGPKYAF